jgi:hypothetical protein
VAFSRESPVILTGNSRGQVDVYRVNGLEHVQVSEKDQINRLLQAIQKDDYTETKGKKKETGGSGSGEGGEGGDGDGANE